MRRALGPAFPVGGLAAGVTALVFLASMLRPGWLDVVVALLLLAGLGLGTAGYMLGATDGARRLGVVAIGWNALGLAALAILYAAG
jgi:hypothetical protein